MAGHSKWANIRHKKGKEDAKRGKAFTKLIKEITVVAREGGGSPDGSPRLRTLIEKARSINMPADNVTRAIKKGTGELPGASYEQFMYEGYGPNGIAVIVDILSDNKNRTVAEMRHLFSKNGGSLGESGSVSWMFEKLGMIRASGGNMSEDELLETLIEHDIENLTKTEELFSISCNPKSIETIKQAVKSAGLTIESADLEWVAKTSMDLSDDQVEKALQFLEALQDHDDVQNVYTNLA